MVAHNNAMPTVAGERDDVVPLAEERDAAASIKHSKFEVGQEATDSKSGSTCGKKEIGGLPGDKLDGSAANSD